ncbi:membrane protein [Bacillus coahuilensis m2-6]|uniref:Membrane protein n=1 Tax=Bacillus coahuilensis p1.1.43 TaxID=1150625 RepID=A0A147K3X0_9BACI|nr:YjiH family protein [Bacillus coahuilensis]KUP03986.1 membrane protein [Bacillus coahuilensis p1.1.43]KUP05001.1 membrane protein [Bacillus coahuilensis m2-6]
MKNDTTKHSVKHIILFLIPSLLGVFFFMTPIPTETGFTIPVAVLSNFVQDLMGNSIPAIMTGLISITALLSLYTKFTQNKAIMQNDFLRNLFNVQWIWVFIRVLGAVFALLTYFQLGPEAIWSEYTGGLLLEAGGLLSILFSIFLFAGLLLPLLLNFGLLEFFSALLTKIMRPLFKLPGRSSIDTLASWLGDGTIGVLLTSKQYEDGYYTKKESAIIGTTFSVVSITFSLVVIQEIGLEDYFVPFYATVALAGFLCAIIMPRIPPLSRKPRTFIDGTTQPEEDRIPPKGQVVKAGFDAAISQAKQNKSAVGFFRDGVKNILDMWLGVAPVVMAIGTTGLILAEYTSLFVFLGTPFVPILELFQLPEAEAAAQTMVVGFADMFLPAIIGSGIESELTRFVIATVSVTQLIYLSEIGGLLLGSKIPVNFIDLLSIFILRTLIALPVIALVGHIIF